MPSTNLMRLLRGGLVATAAALVVPALAAADAPDATSASASVFNNTVVVSGSWAWTTHPGDCNHPHSGVGVAVDWNDPHEPGNHITTLAGDSIDVGTPTDNAVHNTSGGTGGGFNCGTFNGTYNVGEFSGLSHTYSGSLPSGICVVVYDTHGSPVPPRAKDATAGGPKVGRNTDSSVEENDDTPAGDVCTPVRFVQPSVNSSASSTAGPAIALSKAGPDTAQAGSDVAFTLTVTNPGGQPLTGVTVTDARCDAAGPARQTATGSDGAADPTPDSLDSGDTWVYACSAHTAASDTSVHNEATVTATTSSGATVTAAAAADVPLFGQAVAPLLPGTARLSGPAGCISNVARHIFLRGKRIAKVVFSLDGHHVGTLTSPNRGSAYAMTVRGRQLGKGAHLVTVRITFRRESSPARQTLHLALSRCAAVVRPKFTG